MPVSVQRPVFLETTLQNYPDNIEVQGNFPSDTNIIWEFSHNGQTYRGVDATTTSGSLIIPVDGSNSINQNEMVSINGQWRLKFFMVDQAGAVIPVKYQGNVDFIVYTFQQ